MKSVKISNIARQLLPQCRLGLIQCKVQYSDDSSSLDFESLIKDKRELLETSKESALEIISDTRKAYKICGKEPSRYRPSSEALLRRIRTGKDLYRLNNIVDSINLLSISSHYSIGGFNLDKIQGEIFLDVGDAAPYHAIGRGQLNIEFMPGVKDDIGFFGTPTSDSERTMVTSSITSLLLVYYDFSGHKNLESALSEAQGILEKHCGAMDISMSIV